MSFSWALIDLGIRSNPPAAGSPPDSDAIAAAFEVFARLIAMDLLKLGRVEYVDPRTPNGSFGPVRHVEEPIDVVRARVERCCQTANDSSDWAFSCWLVNTDAGDAVARSALDSTD